jgi:hypothetical protein
MSPILGSVKSLLDCSPGSKAVDHLISLDQESFEIPHLAGGVHLPNMTDDLGKLVGLRNKPSAMRH